MVSCLDKLECLLFLVGLFFGINFGLGGNTGARKKLLRFYTGLSARAMVTPVYIWHLWDSFSLVLRSFECLSQADLRQTAVLQISSPRFG